MGSIIILSLERESETHKLMRIRDRATVTIRNGLGPGDKMNLVLRMGS